MSGDIVTRLNMEIKSKFSEWLASKNKLSVLAPLLTIYTLAYIALMGYDFAARGTT